MRILLLLALPAIAITVAGCANVDCTGVPGCSTDGTGGSGGGGTGGTGGSGGGSDDLRLLPQPVLSADPMSFAAEPPSDSVDEDLGVANGEVQGACPGDCSGPDPVDQWTIMPIVTAEYRIDLTWAPSSDSDLDLYLSNSSGAEIGSSATVGTTPELIVLTLAAGQQFTIQVQAFETNGEIQPYTLEVRGN